MTTRVHRFKPPAPISLDGYDLDAFVVTDDDQAPHLDFRFELGRGLGLYWALPAAANDRLRLLHVDGAAYTVDEPELVEDPWVCDLPRIEWPSLHIPLVGGGILVSVAIAMQTQPHSYRCELRLEKAGDHVERIRLSWQGV